MSPSMEDNVGQSSRELQLRRELEALRCRVVVTEALADALMQLRELLRAEEAAPATSSRESVLVVALARVEAVLEANPEVCHG